MQAIVATEAQGPAPGRADASGDAEFEDWVRAHVLRVQELIERALPRAAGAPLPQAMHYAAALGGKRMRPLLVWAAGACAQAQPAALDAAACAVELMHAYSLVHDDLPCMDNDVLRRGQPTAHVKFGEAMALLAGDALQTRAFEVLTAEAALPGALQARLCALLAAAAGAAGMAGGQALDLDATGRVLSREALTEMHRCKTGALLKASVLMGLACAPALEATPALEAAAALERYADAIGLAFQVVDDVLDATADSATLGKTAGKDAQQGKATFVTLLGLEPARALALQLQDEALAALAALPAPLRARSGRLAALARRIVTRGH
jgi:farnesyl diphosphate synthase